MHIIIAVIVFPIMAYIAYLHLGMSSEGPGSSLYHLFMALLWIMGPASLLKAYDLSFSLILGGICSGIAILISTISLHKEDAENLRRMKRQFYRACLRTGIFSASGYNARKAIEIAKRMKLKFNYIEDLYTEGRELDRQFYREHPDDARELQKAKDDRQRAILEVYANLSCHEKQATMCRDKKEAIISSEIYQQAEARRQDDPEQDKLFQKLNQTVLRLEQEIESAPDRPVAPLTSEDAMKLITFEHTEFSVSDGKVGTVTTRASAPKGLKFPGTEQIDAVIDGTIQAKIYCQNLLIATATLVLPRYGLGQNIPLKGMTPAGCAQGVSYTVRFEPLNLWIMGKQPLPSEPPVVSPEEEIQTEPLSSDMEEVQSEPFPLCSEEEVQGEPVLPLLDDDSENRAEAEGNLLKILAHIADHRTQAPVSPCLDRMVSGRHLAAVLDRIVRQRIMDLILLLCAGSSADPVRFEFQKGASSYMIDHSLKILSREQAEKLIAADFPQNTAVISFSDPGGEELDYSAVCDSVFHISLPDIDYDELEEYGYTYESFFPEADELASFIQKAKQDGRSIICQCEYGESRSAGCAAAILEYFHHDALRLFTDFRYCPSKLIYHKVLDGLRK